MNRFDEFREQVMNYGYGFIPAALLQTAFEIDLFEALGESPQSVSTLQSETKVDGRALELLLNALTSLNFVHKVGASYALSPVARQVFLRKGEKYVGDIVKLQGDMQKHYARLAESVRSGRGLEGFSSGLENQSADFMKAFIPAMHNTALGHAERLARKLDLLGAKTLIDIGGGSGAFAIYFLKQNPELRATIYDQSAVIEIAKSYVRQYGLEDRVDYQAGDFNRDPIKGRYDVVFCSHIIHGMNEEKNEKLFRTIFGIMNPGGRFVVQDFFLREDKASPPFAAWFALNMLLHTDGGRTYTFGETERWMRAAGFHEITRPMISLPRSITLLVGRK